MLKAREDNCCLKVRYGKVLICGATEAGKTNFLNLLMEEEFQTKHISTEVAKPQQVTIAMKAQVSTAPEEDNNSLNTQALTENNTKVVFSKMDIDNEIKELMSYLPKKYTTPSKQMDVEPAKEKQHVQIEGNAKPEIRKPTVAEEIMCTKLADKANSKTKKAWSSEKVWDILTFMDTGGQPQFISMLPAVNNFAMITFIVHKIQGGKESLTKNVEIKHRNRNGQDSFEPLRHECTYHQLIKTLMSYASNVLLPSKNFSEASIDCMSDVHVKDKTSSISFIGTHSNDVTANDIKEIDSELTKTVEHLHIENIKPSFNGNYKYLTPVDNKIQQKGLIKVDMGDGRFTKPLKIRNYIQKWLNKQVVYLVPIQWLLLELEIRKVCINRKCSFITYDEVMQLSRNKELGPEEFVKNGLRFHHLFGVLLYFENVKGMCELIITDHQWLFNKLTDIILYSFKDNYDSHLQLINCERRGVFEETMLDDLDISKDFKSLESNTKLNKPKKIFLQLLHYLRIIAPLNENPTQYFMPSLLHSCNLNDLEKKIPGTNRFFINTNETMDSEPLLIQFTDSGIQCDNHVFPRGIFCFLVVQLMQATNWKLCGQSYDNLLSFIIKDNAHYITLIDRIFCLEVQVTRDESSDDAVHEGIFLYIKNEIDYALNKVEGQFKLKYGFWCKKCFDTEKAKEPHITCKSSESQQFYYCINESPTRLVRKHNVWIEIPKPKVFI